ncbi:MAG TPA: hypothetical protein ENN69_04825 [Spirochaetia bacterium]|nr:hypothetical protein [Spirochaetia bacterium]
MIHHTNSFIKRALCFLVIFLFTATAVGFAQAGKKTVKDQGFSFQHPAAWKIIDLGGDNYEGTMGYTKALSPPNESNFAMVIMLFPKFALDLESAGLSYPDFMKMVFENFLAEGEMAGLDIEETDATLQHGTVPAYMVVDDDSEDSFNAALICGDLRNGSAAIIMVSMNIPRDNLENGKAYLDEAEAIMASFTFPK